MATVVPTEKFPFIRQSGQIIAVNTKHRCQLSHMVMYLNSNEQEFRIEQRLSLLAKTSTHGVCFTNPSRCLNQSGMKVNTNTTSKSIVCSKKNALSRNQEPDHTIGHHVIRKPCSVMLRRDMICLRHLDHKHSSFPLYQPG